MYRRDSDIYMPYGPKADEFRRRLTMETGKNVSLLKSIIRKKNKLSAWMVSNCESKSGRNDYVEELKKYINIDVYGACGSLKCDDSNNTNACCKYKLIGQVGDLAYLYLGY